MAFGGGPAPRRRRKKKNRRDRHAQSAGNDGLSGPMVVKIDALLLIEKKKKRDALASYYTQVKEYHAGIDWCVCVCVCPSKVG